MAHVHPKTGLRYIHVMNKTSLVFSETFRCYEHASKSCPWMGAVPIQDFKAAVQDENSPLYRREDLCYIIWHPFYDPKLAKRKARLAMHYSEMVCKPGDLPPLQQNVMKELDAASPLYDIIFVHTKHAVDILKHRRVRYAPVGYEPSIMGVPNFQCPKEYGLVFYGSFAGTHRKGVFSLLKAHLKDKIDNISGSFGANRKKLLDKSRAILDISHAPKVFATMRLWHAISSSAVLFIQPMDTWPAIPNRHYIQIPTVTKSNAKTVAQFIDGVMSNVDLSSVARKAHEELSIYTPKYCMENFVIPETEKL